jgi:hypothetical protein
MADKNRLHRIQKRGFAHGVVPGQNGHPRMQQNVRVWKVAVPEEHEPAYVYFL